jgi:hypothetical protein
VLSPVPISEPRLIEARNRRRERRLWEQPRGSTSLGCTGCTELGECGGLHTKAALFDCMGHCCGQPGNCTMVCRLKPRRFVEQVREIGGFGLENTSRGPTLSVPELPEVVPMIYHGNRRKRLYEGPAVALSMHRLLSRTTGLPKHLSEEALRAEFHLGAATRIILTGTDQDPPLERWWGYGVDGRRAAITALRGLGVSLVSVPNYSLFADVPRWDDLHAMKRIALVHAEFLDGGVPAALHVNARSERDAERWRDYVRDREEITHLAYEFATGAGRVERRNLHADWLARIASAAARPLTLVIRGGIEVLPVLTQAFASVVSIETSAFMKTMKRQQAALAGNGGLAWSSVPTEADQPLDDLFDHNLRLCNETIRLLRAPPLSIGAAAE